MRGLILNVVLALVWALFSGEVSTRELTVGFLLGFAILQVFPRALGTTDYVFTTRRVLGFAWFFARELTFANIQVAAFALRRHPPLNPMIVAVPLTLKTDTGLTLLAALITLMPGTVAMGFSPDRRRLYAHAVGLPGPNEAVESILKVERQLLGVLEGGKQ